MTQQITKQFVAVRAFIMNDGKVLIIRESQKYEGGNQKGKYDLPGGKIKVGETYQEAIQREVQEECGINVEIEKPFFVSEWRPTVKGEQIQIIAIFFECKASSAAITLSQDHDDYQWIDPKDYKNYTQTEANYSAFETYLHES